MQIVHVYLNMYVHMYLWLNNDWLYNIWVGKIIYYMI